MRQLDDKIAEINSAIYATGLRCDLKGLAEEVRLNGKPVKREIGTEVNVSFSSDQDLFAYHVQDGEIDFSNFRERGKRTVYYPVAKMSLIGLCKDRFTEEKIINILKGISNIKIKSSDPDKYRIWKDETGNEEHNFDLHLFRIGYDFHFATSDCNNSCR